MVFELFRHQSITRISNFMFNSLGRLFRILAPVLRNDCGLF